ncbi:LuxR family transcriptional regulator [Streptomyces sp. NPDC051921]|uniref:helix-turn-helix transcriptional regulator n=1 Tax=Streptomyces sp. NPDC051921 TaxID=3155806 RepID=UPI00342E8FE3
MKNTDVEEGCVDRAPFAGRRAELARLEALLALRLRAPDAPTAVDLTGEPGIGKSRLLTEFAARARRAGLTVLHGRAVTDGTPPTPFQVFADAFADLPAEPRGGAAGERPQPGPPTGAAPAPGRAEPFPQAMGPDGRRLGARPRDWPEPYGFFRRTSETLAGAAGPGLVVLLDDLHGADRASLDLLDHLLSHPVAAPVLLVLARRETPAPPGQAAVLARGSERGTLARMALGPLDEEECAVHLAPTLPRERVAELHAASGGNPAYFLALAGGRGSEAARTAVLGELAPLGALPRAAVDAVALLADGARTDLLPTVTGADREGLATAVQELVRLDVVRPRPDGRLLTLRHPVLAALVRRAMDPLRRREYHRRAAEALAADGAPVTERAGHIERYLTRWEPAAAADLVRAAETTEATDPALTARRLAVVLRVLPHTAEHHPERVALELRRARALGHAGQVAESRDLLHRLIALCGPPGTRPDAEHRDRAPTAAPRGEHPASRSGTARPRGDEDTRTEAVLLCAFMERHLGRYREADALVRRALRRAPGPRAALRLRLVVEWGCRALFETRFPEARGELDAVLADARLRGDETGAVEALTLGALGEAYEGETDAARAHAQAAAGLVDAMTDGELTACCEALVRLGWSEIFLDDRSAAERHTTRGITLARRAGRPFALSQLLLCAGYVHALTGRVDSALRLADESLALAHTLGGAEVIGFSRAIRATIVLFARPLGDPEALTAAEEAAATVGAADGWWGTLARSLLATAIPVTEDPHRVRDVLLTAGGGPGLPRIQPSLRPTFLELLVTAALAVGDPAEARRAARRAESEADRLGLPVQRAAALRCRARLSAHAGEPAAAARLFAEAARDYARSGVTLREAHTLLLAAPVARASGDRDGAAAMWRRGRRLAAAGGARLLVDVADRTRALALGPDAPARPPAVAPAGPLSALTPREREISALVAEGLTNQAVAERLSLSPRTVESHVARVYRKTGVVTRAALASLVARATR